MDAKITVRARIDSDIPEAANVLIDVYEKDGYPVEGVVDPQSWLISSALIQAWVATIGDRIIGHVALTTVQDGDDAPVIWATESGRHAEEISVLGRLFVHPDARGHAIGEQLIQAVMDRAAQLGLDLTLDVMEKDQSAIRLYEHLGWQRIGTVSHHFGINREIPAYCYRAPLP